MYGQAYPPNFKIREFKPKVTPKSALEFNAYPLADNKNEIKDTGDL